MAGEGPGIEPFRPNRGPLKLSTNLIIENLAKVLEVAPETIDTVADTAVVDEGATTGNHWRPWTAEEAQAAIGGWPYNPYNHLPGILGLEETCVFHVGSSG